MSNRRKIKGGTGRVTPRGVTPRGVRPTGGQHGVEVDVDKGMVFFTVHAGEVTFCAGWLSSDAEMVAKLIADGARQASQGVEKSPEIVRESGIVVARALPPT